MSKSLGNGVDLGAQIDEFGVDAVRLTVVFAGPPEEDIDWADVSPAGSLRFLQRAHRLAAEVSSAAGCRPVSAATWRCAARPTGCWPTSSTAWTAQRFNVAVARIMELVNVTRKAIDAGAGAADPAVREAAEVITVALSMVAPYVAEEMWEQLGHAPSVANATWPTVDPSPADHRVGDLRRPGPGQGTRPAGGAAVDRPRTSCEALALADEAVSGALAGREVAKVIVRAPKLVSIVVGS